ncbi:hypothetical protein ACJMK2_022312 [Sinanodonta woodiana]|uniref:Methyltransferase domain-containing protein n=1 Tax=Sinanodonta woodiana TaxID=1069815 RepID=A0ABD3TK04_SINWO
MADLSKKEWEKYQDPGQAHVYKNIATVMQKGIEPAQVSDFYSKWAGDENGYEQELPDQIFNSPRTTAASAAESFPPDKRADVKVIDVAAGTGLCGEELRKHGFQHIDALDPSEGMLSKARAKNIYERIICDYITDKRLDIESDTYDLLTVSAGFGEGHIPCSALHEMVRIVKPGGVICLVTREEHLRAVEEYRNRLEPLMQTLEEQGKWKRVCRQIFPGFFLDKEGILWKYKVC